MAINVGFEVLSVASQTFEHQDKELAKQIHDLSTQRAKMQLLADCMHQLSVGIQQKKSNFNSDENAKEIFLATHRLYPHLFDHVIQGFPEGVLAQEIALHDLSGPGVVQACLEGVFPNQVTIAKLGVEDLQALVRGVESQLDMVSASTNQVAFEITRIFGDREQIVKIVHEMLRQIGELLKGINRNTPSRG